MSNQFNSQYRLQDPPPVCHSVPMFPPDVYPWPGQRLFCWIRLVYSPYPLLQKIENYRFPITAHPEYHNWEGASGHNEPLMLAELALRDADQHWLLRVEFRRTEAGIIYSTLDLGTIDASKPFDSGLQSFTEPDQNAHFDVRVCV